MNTPLARLATVTLAALVFVAPATSAAAQAPHTDLSHAEQSWLQMTFQGPISGDWFLQADLQYRAFENMHPSAVIARGALAYRLMDGMFVSLGYGWQPGWRRPAREPEHLGFFDEHRIYEQWQWELVDGGSGVRLQMRARLEQRFRYAGAVEFGLRARELVRFAAPLSSDRNVLFIAWDELFEDLNDAGRSSTGLDANGNATFTPGWQWAGFDQNRLFVGVGFQMFPGSLRVEIGYLNQWVRRPNNAAGDLMNHVALVNTVINWR